MAGVQAPADRFSRDGYGCLLLGMGLALQQVLVAEAPDLVGTAQREVAHDAFVTVLVDELDVVLVAADVGQGEAVAGMDGVVADLIGAPAFAVDRREIELADR